MSENERSDPVRQSLLDFIAPCARVVVCETAWRNFRSILHDVWLLAFIVHWVTRAIRAIQVTKVIRLLWLLRFIRNIRVIRVSKRV